MDKFTLRTVFLKTKEELSAEGWITETIKHYNGNVSIALTKGNRTITPRMTIHLGAKIKLMGININKTDFAWNQFVWPIEVMSTEMESIEAQMRREIASV